MSSAPGTVTGPARSSAASSSTRTRLLQAIPEIIVVDVVLEAIDRVQLRGWLGSELHGALGAALREVGCSDACARRHEREPDRCAYAHLLETPARPEGISDRVAAMAPHRLWLRPSGLAEPEEWAPGDRLRFEIGLARSAEPYLPALLTALERMAASGVGNRRGTMRLERVSAGGRPVWEGGQVKGRPRPVETLATPSGPVVLRTRTPLRVLRDGRARPPRFEDLVGASARRLVAMAAFHGAGEPDLHVSELVQAATRHRARIEAVWEPFRVERYSARQRKWHPMDGHLGEMRVDEPGDFAPLLVAAAPFGVGKGTSFGFGVFNLLPGEP